MARLTRTQVRAQFDERFLKPALYARLYTAKNKQFFFCIEGRNGQPVTTSETYRTRNAAEYAIARLLQCGLQANFVDETKPAKTAGVKPVKYVIKP
jgi:uncharacterized protein YegP (UPF0339 family)